MRGDLGPRPGWLVDAALDDGRVRGLDGARFRGNVDKLCQFDERILPINLLRARGAQSPLEFVKIDLWAGRTRKRSLLSSSPRPARADCAQ